jgi:hypothetical protein
MASTIGIKIANGEFYSIIEENSNVKKRLILTTVHDSQKSMQIDLYKSYVQSMADALYIGSIVVENISPKPKGDPSVELIIGSKDDGVISAVATDMDASAKGEHLHLSVSLKSFDEENRDIEFPDFELEPDDTPPLGLYEKAQAVKKQDERKKFPWIIILIVILVLLLGFALWFFLIRGRSGGESTPPVTETRTTAPRAAEAAPTTQAAEPAPSAPAVQAAEPAPPPVQAAPEPIPVIEAPASPPAPVVSRRTRTPAPVASYRVPAVIPREGAPYTIRWGDTLWDIAEAFYRNPWLYPRIARFNNIRNPNLIISGTTIRIPPRN